MALLDVTQILTDPDLVDTFSVRRRLEVVGNDGFTTQTEQLFQGLLGVITSIGPSNLDRHEDYQNMARSISVVCRFALRGETTNYQPDIVVWRGDNFLVKQLDPYPQFGPGFFQAECSSIDKTDVALELGLVPQLDFRQNANSIYSILK